MRLIMFKFGESGRKIRHRRKGMDIERMLFLSAIVVFCMLVLVQTALTSPSVRTFLNAGTELEGKPLGAEEYLYGEGRLCLRLMDGEINSDIKLLVNGDEAACFDSEAVELAVKDGDVIEVDASLLAHDRRIVEIIAKSGNIPMECVGRKVEVGGGVKQIMTVRVSEEG